MSQAHSHYRGRTVAFNSYFQDNPDELEDLSWWRDLPETAQVYWLAVARVTAKNPSPADARAASQRVASRAAFFQRVASPAAPQPNRRRQRCTNAAYIPPNAAQASGGLQGASNLLIGHRC
jgi:hypothetical protein